MGNYPAGGRWASSGVASCPWESSPSPRAWHCSPRPRPAAPRSPSGRWRRARRASSSSHPPCVSPRGRIRTPCRPAHGPSRPRASWSRPSRTAGARRSCSRPGPTTTRSRSQTATATGCTRRASARLSSRRASCSAPTAGRPGLRSEGSASTSRTRRRRSTARSCTSGDRRRTPRSAIPGSTATAVSRRGCSFGRRRDSSDAGSSRAASAATGSSSTRTTWATGRDRRSRSPI